jgi:hypothetical protein
VGFAVGGVLVVLGATLILTAGTHEPGTTAHLSLSPTVAPGRAGLTMDGAF